MAYELIIDNKNKNIEVHWDMCDDLMEKKDDFLLNNMVEYVNLIDFEEVEAFLNKEEYKEFEKNFCKSCKPEENREKYNEEYDDFYEEFPEDEDIDNSRCDIF
ncbi:hypothetical protein [Caminibacter sp.]